MKMKFFAVFLAVFFLSCSAWGETTSAPADSTEKKSEKKKQENPIIAIPGGILGFLYSAFNGVGSLFDAVGTGDKAPEGSLEGKEDPLPVTTMERQF